MKLEVPIEKLKNAVMSTERITGKNLTLPVLNSILLMVTTKSIRLRSTNLSLGIEIEIPAKVEKEGIAAISGGVLSGIFSNITDGGVVTLEGADGNLVVKTKKSNIKL